MTQRCFENWFQFGSDSLLFTPVHLPVWLSCGAKLLGELASIGSESLLFLVRVVDRVAAPIPLCRKAARRTGILVWRNTYRNVDTKKPRNPEAAGRDVIALSK